MPSRKQIPKHIRTLVWNKYVGEDVVHTKCFCCDVTSIRITCFDCGHVKSVAHGGQDTIENLRPVCSQCNLSMGTRDMREFMKTHGLNPDSPLLVSNDEGNGEDNAAYAHHCADGEVYPVWKAICNCFIKCQCGEKFNGRQILTIYEAFLLHSADSEVHKKYLVDIGCEDQLHQNESCHDQSITESAVELDGYCSCTRQCLCGEEFSGYGIIQFRYAFLYHCRGPKHLEYCLLTNSKIPEYDRKICESLPTFVNGSIAA